MKRHPTLQDLSRDHFVALNHVLRIERIVKGHAMARPLEGEAQRFLFWAHGPMQVHFAEEEQFLLPLLRGIDRGLADRLVQDHEALRAMADRLSVGSGLDAWWRFAERLRFHAKWEEASVFPVLEKRVPPRELERLALQCARFRKAEGMPTGPQ